MKATTLFSLVSILAASPVLSGAPTEPPERQSLKIIQTEEARFPWMLSQSGITEGWAVITITVDAEGKLLDALPVSYTRRPFADAAVDALRRWRYEPARIRGHEVGAQVELIFNFEAVGVVVTFDLDKYLNRFVAEKPAYKPCSLRELDRVPTPVEAATPAYSDELAKMGVWGQAIVEFYIDESGTVRVPAVVSADFEELGVLAVSAVETWKFEPPTSRNAPVLAKVRQTFHFRP